MAQSNSSENNFEFRQGISSRRSYFSLVYTVKTFLFLFIFIFIIIASQNDFNYTNHDS